VCKRLDFRHFPQSLNKNIAAFIFSQLRIEEIISTPGDYEYQNGQKSIFNGYDITGSILNQAKDRIGFGGC